VANKITYKRKCKRGTTREETCMEVAKAGSARTASARYSVNFMTLQKFYKRFEEEVGSKFYIKQIYNSFQK
jgi:hypothetical protein